MGSLDIHIDTYLTGTDAVHLQELLKQSGRSTSEVLRAALHAYHTQCLAPKPDPQQLLASFVSSGEGPQDLSLHYKDYLFQEEKDQLLRHINANQSHNGDE